jgi:hypothetical protein
MNHKAVEYTLLQVAPDQWLWRFQIGKTVITGKTNTKLKGMAEHRVHDRINRMLRMQRG